MKNRYLLLLLTTLFHGILQAHPLGIFSVNRYTRIELAGERVRLFYVMDVAEIPSIQELASIDVNKDGRADDDERRIYVDQKIAQLLRGMRLRIDGKEAILERTRDELSFPEGQGGLKTIRMSSIFETTLSKSETGHTLSFTDDNFASGRGWKEIVAVATHGEEIQQSSVPENDVTNELRSYPPERLSNPLNVSGAELRFLHGNGTITSLTRSVVQRTKDGFAELISAKQLSLPVMLISLVIAMILGAGHALTPGHGKTVVAAYLVGSRGTAKHAAFLGVTVTATHTIGVFAMGFIALFASQYILPEDLFPCLSFISGLIVVVIGLSLFFKRLSFARGSLHTHDGNTHTHTHDHHDGYVHTHGGHTHSHLPPGTDGAPIAWKSLFALGISGGLLPCPSAIVVLLSAIALGRIGFGLLLIVAFSVGLAGVLTGIGLLMVYVRRFFERFNTGGPLLRWLPVMSALVVAVAGTIISLQAVAQSGVLDSVNLPAVTLAASGLLSAGVFQAGTLSVLGLGFILGLKHALDADHLVAVSTIVSERKGFMSSSIVGALWGLGHTASLLIVGLLVIALHIQIPEKVALGMEFAVAAMLVGLGINVIWKLIRGGKFHYHAHSHADHKHSHPHLHAHQHAGEHDHTRPRLLFRRFPERLMQNISNGKRSILIGMVHGMAGSAALMLIVLATIPSRTLALAYIGIFGLGSIGGMFVMSTLIGIPFVITAHTSQKVNILVRGISGVLSVGFGLFLAWQIAFADGLFL